MKKDGDMGDDQLSFLGAADESRAQTQPKKTAPKAVPPAAKSLRMPSLEPVFGGKPVSKEMRDKTFAENKQQALTKLQNLATRNIEANSTQKAGAAEKALNTPKAMAVTAEKTSDTQKAASATNVADVAAEEPPSEMVKDEPVVYSISEINQAIRSILEGAYSVIWLRGEISNFKPHSSGHFYFSLKDQKAQINAVMFRQFNTRLGFKPHDGMEVLVRGKITVYEPRGNYQIFCELMEPVGLGALQMAYEQLKKRLEQEGLFEPSRKRPLPAFPMKVAIVTSPTGAAIRDMLNVLGRRFKGLDITLVPATVQGESAPREIVAAIETANQVGGFDVMIVGRGGGSIEDLWAFNNENVCRAIAASKIPIVSAVGHEVDFTLADFVADLRAPTPSAAAELIVKNMSELSDALGEDRKRLINLTAMSLRRMREKLTHIEARVIDPQRRLQDAVQRCDELVDRLENSLQRTLQNQKMRIDLLKERMGTPAERIAQRAQQLDLQIVQLRARMARNMEHKMSRLGILGGKLDSLSPLRVVERGFAVVTSKDKIVTDYKQLKVGDPLKIQFARGQATATVESLKEDGVENEQKQIQKKKKTER